MAEPFLGELKLVPYNFAPTGWALCQGQLLAISQNTALFALLGTTYGGNGVTTFGLPDLRGRTPLNVGEGPGLSPYDQGQVGGTETETLTSSQLPAHSHSMRVSPATANNASPAGMHPATATAATGNAYGTSASGQMPASTVSTVGGGQPHNNRQPYLGLNFVIALQGVFPQRP